MVKVRTEIIKAIDEGYTVQFWIDQQGFTLNLHTDKKRAKWFKKMLDIALNKLKNNNENIN